MLSHEIDEQHRILMISPSGSLSAQDFKQLTDVVDDYNATHEPLQAVMIETEHFPGWDSFGALFQHLKFIRDSRAQIKQVAAVTDSGFLTIMPHVIDHFIQADVRHFAYSDRAEAMRWLTAQ